MLSSLDLRYWAYGTTSVLSGSFGESLVRGVSTDGLDGGDSLASAAPLPLAAFLALAGFLVLTGAAAPSNCCRFRRRRQNHTMAAPV